jgi:ribonucleoside-diphosphate reductase alpha chain
MLDNVLQYFIDNAPSTVHRAVYSASRERSIGVGALGFHAYLQKNNIAIEDTEAVITNRVMFKHIRKRLNEANIRLGKERGEAPDAAGTGFRFSHLIAIAPNASSSIIMGNTSPSIEPFRANAYRQDTLSGAGLNKNRFLDAILRSKCEELNLDITEVWSTIMQNDGSVQELDFLDEHTKNVFKTAMELDQRILIELAADRQEYIDQGQSLNLFFLPTADVKYLHAAHFLAWKKGLKTLYYCRSEKIKKADKVSKLIKRQIIEEIDIRALAEETCLACEG